MTSISRRLALSVSAAAAAGSSLWAGSQAALASVPPSGQQAPGYYRAQLGDMELTVVNDGVSRMPITDDFVKNVPKAEVNATLDALFLERDFYAGPYNPLVVNAGGKLALIDTGTGEIGFKSSGGINGRLHLSLAAAGIKPSDIDVVILTHYHGDHINGLTRADDTLAFPNAEILAPEAEQAFWMNDGEMSRAASPRLDATFKNARRVMRPEVLKRLRTYAWDKEVLPGIMSLRTPGHTPGHSSLILSSGAKSLYVQGDVTHAPYLFARNPGWHFMLDVDPVAAEATRRKVYDMLCAERMFVQGFHYPFPALGHVEKTASGYREVLVQWSPTL